MRSVAPPKLRTRAELYFPHYGDQKACTRKVRTRPGLEARKANVWDQIVEIGNAIPDDVIARMPRDGAKNFDHYLHGSPKQK